MLKCITPRPLMAYRNRSIRRLMIVLYFPLGVLHDITALARHAAWVWRQP